MKSQIKEIMLKFPQAENEKNLLLYACEKENVELVKQLISIKEIDINLLSIYIIISSRFMLKFYKISIFINEISYFFIILFATKYLHDIL